MGSHIKRAIENMSSVTLARPETQIHDGDGNIDPIDT